MAINKLPGFGALDLNNQEVINGLNVIPLYEEGAAYGIGDQVIFREKDEMGNNLPPKLYTFNEQVDLAPATFPMEMVTDAGTIIGAGPTLPTTNITNDEAVLGELFSLTAPDNGRIAGVYRRIADDSGVAAWETIADKALVDTALGTGSPSNAVGSFYATTGNWVVPPDTTYTFAEDKTEGSGTISNLQVFVDGSTTSTTDIQLGATQATFIPGVTDEQGIFLSLVRNGESISGGTAEFVNTTTVHGDPDVQESLYLDWEVINGRAALNSAGLDARFEDTYRKNEIETWVENDIPVNSKQAIQYYEVQGRPNRDETAAPGALSSEDIEFSQFEVDLGLQRRTGAVSDYISKAISFTISEDTSAVNAGHWTVAVGANATIFVIKDEEYKEFKMVDSDTGRVTDLHLRCVAYDHLHTIRGNHDDQFIRIGCSQGIMFNFLLSELNKDPKVQRNISASPSRTNFTNEDITALAIQYSVDDNSSNRQTIAFGTSQGHISYVSQRINANGLQLSDYIAGSFNANDAHGDAFPANLVYPTVAGVVGSLPPGYAKDGVWVRDIKWTGAREFVAVGNHQASTRVGTGIPGDALGAPLIAYFRNIQDGSFGNQIPGNIYYLNTPFEEVFFDNLIGQRNGESDSEALSDEPTGVSNDGSNLPTLNQLFGTALTSVVQVRIGVQDWLYMFGSRIDHTDNQKHRAFGIKVRLSGTRSIIEALDEHVATNGNQPIEGFIDWHLVNQISEINGWQHSNSLGLTALNNAQHRYVVRGGGSVIPDQKIIDIFGNNRTVVSIDADNDGLTLHQDAEDDLNHSTNGWLETDNILGGWIGNTGVEVGHFDLSYQTLTILGQSQGTTPLYGISKYTADITVTLSPLNGDADIVLGPIRVQDAQGELLRTNFLNPLAALFNAPAAGVLQNAPANETATVSTYDSLYGVATISFASDTRDFDISVTTPDIHQIVNHDEDTFDFILRFSQDFVAGEGQEIFVLAHPRLASVDGTQISPDDQITLLTSTTDSTPLDKSLYDILFTVDGLELQINSKATGEGLPFGTLVQVTYGYDTPAYYQFIHNIATSIVVHDPYHGGSGTIHVPVGMAFADDNALVDYLVGKLSALFAATNIEVLQEGNSSVIEFRSTLRGDQPGDLILDDDQKIMITVTNPATDPNLENVGVLQINRLFNGDTDFPGKFPSTFDFDNALTETDLRSVLHQVFANVGSVGGLNVPVTTAIGDEVSVINSANESLYEDNRIITESYIAEQVVSKHIAGTESSAFTGSVNFVDGSFVDATGVTLDFTGSDVHGFTEHIQIGRGLHTFNSIDNIFYTAESTTVEGTTSIGFATHADYLTFLNEIGLPTVGTGVIQVTAGVNVTLNITRTTGNIDETFTISDDVQYYYVDPQNPNSRIIFFYNENVSGLPSADIGNATLEVSIPNSSVGVTRLDAGTGIGITVTGDVAEINYTGASGGGLATVATDTTISGTGVDNDNALSVVYGTGINTALQGNAIHIGGLGTPAEGSVPFHTGGNWTLNNRISGTRVVDVSVGSHGVPVDHIAWLSDTEQYVNSTASGATGVTNAYDFVGEGWLRLGAAGGGIVKSVTVGAAGTTQSFNATTGALAIAESFTGGGGEGDVTAAGDNVFTGDNVFETNSTKGFEVASYADDAGNGPSLVIDRKRQTSPNVNAVAVDGDDIGVIRFQGNDDKAGTNATYASIGASIDSAKDDNPVGQLYIKVADGNGAGGGKAGSHVRIEGKSNGGATIEIDSDADLTVDGTTTLNGTIVTNGPLTSDSVHVVSGTGHQLRSDANIILNGLVTGSGITTFTSAVLANRGIRSAVAGSGISITPSADGFSETFTSSNTVAQGNISIPSDSGIITATGDRDNIQRFLDRAGLLRYVDLTDNTPIEAAPVRLNGRLLNNIRTEAESDGDFFLNNATQSSTSVTQGSAFNREWSEMSSVIMMGNPNNVSVEHWLLGDSLFIYQPNEARDRWAVYRVDSVGTTSSGDQYANLTYVNSHGTPNISSTGSRDGDDVVVVGSLRDVVPDGAAFQYSTVIAFDSADGIKYRDTLDALTVEGVFDLIGSGIASNGTDITSAGNFNGAPVNAMAYLAIQLNSFEPVQVDASTTLSTVYADETVIAGGTSEDVAITYQAILDGSAAATGGIATDFDNYIYVLYKSVYNNNIAAIFLDRIDGNGTTFTTHSFAQGGAASTIQTVVVPQSL